MTILSEANSLLIYFITVQNGRIKLKDKYIEINGKTGEKKWVVTTVDLILNTMKNSGLKDILINEEMIH